MGYTRNVPATVGARLAAAVAAATAAAVRARLAAAAILAIGGTARRAAGVLLGRRRVTRVLLVRA